MKFKIVYLVSTLDNQGPVNVLYNMLSESDIAFRESVCIITLSPELRTTRISDFENLGIKNFCLNIRGGTNFLLLPIKLKNILKKIQPKIIHTHCFSSSVVSGFFFSSKYKVVCSIQNNPFDDFPMFFGKIKGTIMAKVQLKALKRVEKVVVCSDFIKTNIISHLNIAPQVIYNGVENPKFEPSSYNEKQIWRKKNKINPDNKVFIYIANLIPRKNPEMLIEGFKEIMNKRDDVTLLVIGDGQLKYICEESAKNYRNIHFIGRVNNISDYLRNSDYFVSTSYSEGMPTVVMNACSYGIPSILSDITPHIEMMKNIQYDFFFEVGNVQSLIDKITIFIKENDSGIQNNVFSLYKNKFSAKQMFNNYSKIYDSI